MKIQNELLVLCGAILTSVIAGAFSYLNLITSKEQKISEFRQSWIDSLRTSIADYISTLSYMSIFYKRLTDETKGKHKKSEITNELQNTYIKLNKCYNDIIFRVNDSEVDKNGKSINNSFLIELNAIRDLYNQSKYIEAFNRCTSLRELTKPLLKYEWKRVKEGEKSFRRAKYLSQFFLFIGVALLIFLLIITFNK